MNLYFSGLIKNLQSIGNGFDLMFYLVTLHVYIQWVPTFDAELCEPCGMSLEFKVSLNQVLGFLKNISKTPLLLTCCLFLKLISGYVTQPHYSLLIDE